MNLKNKVIKNNMWNIQEIKTSAGTLGIKTGNCVSMISYKFTTFNKLKIALQLIKMVLHNKMKYLRRLELS